MIGFAAIVPLLLGQGMAASEAPSCAAVLGEAVPRAEVARKIAEAVIGARQRPEVRMRYNLRVETEPGVWLAYQSLRSSVQRVHNGFIVTYGGGGIAMRIDRCTGEISEMHYQR